MADQSAVIIKQLNELSLQLSSEHGAREARKEALQLSKMLTASLEQPENVAVELAFSPFLAIAARIAIGLNLFRHIADSEGPVDSKTLASLSNGEELLIVRTLRPLASIGFVREVGPQAWEATPVTKAMAMETIAAGHRMVGEMIVGAMQKAPNYLSEAGYRCPVDPHDGFMQYAFQTKLTTFELFSSIPRVFEDFNMFMGNTMGARKYWVDWFPIEERLLSGANDSSALVVDVGGGKGHDLLAFQAKYPHQGRLVLQDVAPVINNLTGLDAAIEPCVYDFFMPQPIKGARSYLFHHILHDWSDKYCLQILEHVKTAMTPGYSKLLIHEVLVPETGADTFAAVYDLVMMAFNAGMERTESQWSQLIEMAGLEVVKFWQPPEPGADGIIEVMLKAASGH